VRTPGKRERAEKQEEVPSAGGTIASSSDLQAGDRVVYPKQGVYRVTGLEQKDIAGQRLEFVKMTREENGASVLVPLGKVATIGLRRVASAGDIEGVFHYLGATYDDPELDWKVRHRDNVERLIAGGVLGVAEVVKGLHSLSRLRPLPAKERELYDSSRHLLVNEISVSLGVPDVIAEDYIDYALMPPAGVKLPLKKPPTPVELKGPPWKRKKPAASEDDDLGLAELGIDLRAIEGASAGGAEDSEEGEAEGEEKKPAEEGEEEEAVPVKASAPAVKPPPPAKKAAPAPKAAPPAKPAAPAKKAAPPAAKRAAPARKTARPPAKKAAPAPKAAPPAKPAAPAKKAAPPAAKRAAPARKTARPPAKKASPPPAKKGAAKKAAPAKKPAPKKASPAKKPVKPAKGKKK
jgi:CarD family transcriptional regulator